MPNTRSLLRGVVVRVREGSCARPPVRRFVASPLLCAVASLSLTACATVGTRDVSAGIRDAIAREQQLDVSKFPPRSVAVLPMASPAGDSIAEALSWAMSEMLSQDLARNRSVQVLERRRIGALLQEIANGQTARFDSRTAPRAGRLLGARRVAAGDVTREAGTDRYQVSLRTLDVATGERSAELRATFRLDDVFAGEAELSRQLAVALGLRPRSGDPAERGPITPEALVRFGRGVSALAVGNVAAGRSELAAATKASPRLENAARTAREPVVAGGGGDATDDRRARLREAAVAVQPLAPVRTAEVADVAAAAVVRSVTLGLLIILP